MKPVVAPVRSGRLTTASTGARRDPGVVFPDRLEQRCATQDETGPRGEPFQHIELLSRERDGLSTTHDRTPLVDDEY